MWKLVLVRPRTSLEFVYNFLPPAFSFWKPFASHRGPPGQLPHFLNLSYFLSVFVLLSGKSPRFLSSTAAVEFFISAIIFLISKNIFFHSVL